VRLNQQIRRRTGDRFEVVLAPAIVPGQRGF